MRYYQAQDTFAATLDDGTDRLVAKGEPFPETHELVKRDAEATKATPGREPLFRPLGEDEPPQAAKRQAPTAAPRKAKA